jgi:hypothetical protein
MIRQPHPTDGMTDEQKQAYFAQKTITREVGIVIEPRTGMIGGKVNDFTNKQRAEVNQANDYLESL